jgi:hypothetical protein
MRTKILSAFVLIALIVAACGGGGGGSVDRSEDGPMLQIVSEGGFVPVEVALNNGPRYTLLGDGRLIYQGVQTLEFPGRLVPPYMVGTLDDNQMDAILAMVEDIGLPDIHNEVDDSAIDFVADASTEVITYWDDAGEHRYGIYALGIEESPSERNAALLELTQTLDQFVGQADAEPYVADRVRIVAGEGFVDPEFEDIRPWPLEDSDFSDWETLPNDWQCTVVDGPVPAVFEGATQATTWEHPDGTSDPVTLLVRPLHPGEPDCPA